MTSVWINIVVLAALVCVSLSEKGKGKTDETPPAVAGPVAFVYEPLTGQLINVPVTREEVKAKDVSKRWLFGRRRRRRGRGSASVGLGPNGVQGSYTNGNHGLNGHYNPSNGNWGIRYTYSFGKKK